MARIIALAISALEAFFSDATADAAFLLFGMSIGGAMGVIFGFAVAGIASAAIVAFGGVALTVGSANAIAAIMAGVGCAAVYIMAR